MTRVTSDKAWSLASLAERHALLWQPVDCEAQVDHACALTPGSPGGIAFAENAHQLEAVQASRATAVIVAPALAALAPVTEAELLVVDAPRLTFARVAAHFVVDTAVPGIHETAVIAASAIVHATAEIGPRVVIGERATVGAGVRIGAGAVVADEVVIGQDCRIGPNVSLLAASRLADRVSIEAGAVIGARGFGLVPGPEGMEPVPQLGRVRIGHDVEIGANTTIDRGALDDTIVHDRVKIDNQVHIAHNCVIGAHTVIAGCTGIAGSCHIGARCLIGGGVGIGDHVTITDDVVITAASQVPKHISKPGVYSSTFRAMPARSWRKRLALFRALDRIEGRLRRLEQNN